MKLLSIVIPSYNRYHKLTPAVKSMLESKSKDFEIVVVDNGTPNIPQEFLEIEDDRLELIKREKVVKGPVNLGTCLEFASGEFVLEVIDKDRFPGCYIDEFIEALKEKRHVFGGYCAQNKNDKRKSVEVCNNEPLLKFGWMVHPSGNFYKTDIIKEFIKNSDELIYGHPYAFNFYMLKCASLGAMMVYDKPSIYTCTPEEIKEEKTLSYFVDDGTLHFSPDNSINNFAQYKEFIDGFNLEDNYHFKVLEKLYDDTLYKITLGYKNILMNEPLCTHYNIKMRNVTKKEMNANIQKLNKKLYEVNNDNYQNEIIIKNGLLYYRKSQLKQGVRTFTKKVIGTNNYKKLKNLIKGTHES